MNIKPRGKKKSKEHHLLVQGNGVGGWKVIFKNALNKEIGLKEGQTVFFYEKDGLFMIKVMYPNQDQKVPDGNMYNLVTQTKPLPLSRNKPEGEVDFVINNTKLGETLRDHFKGSFNVDCLGSIVLLVTRQTGDTFFFTFVQQNELRAYSEKTIKNGSIIDKRLTISEDKLPIENPNLPVTIEKEIMNVNTTLDPIQNMIIDPLPLSSMSSVIHRTMVNGFKDSKTFSKRFLESEMDSEKVMNLDKYIRGLNESIILLSKFRNNILSKQNV